MKMSDESSAELGKNTPETNQGTLQQVESPLKKGGFFEQFAQKVKDWLTEGDNGKVKQASQSKEKHPYQRATEEDTPPDYVVTTKPKTSRQAPATTNAEKGYYVASGQYELDRGHGSIESDDNRIAQLQQERGIPYTPKKRKSTSTSAQQEGGTLMTEDERKGLQEQGDIAEQIRTILRRETQTDPALTQEQGKHEEDVIAARATSGNSPVRQTTSTTTRTSSTTHATVKPSRLQGLYSRASQQKKAA